MKPRFVTFDCAGTILKVDWSPGDFAVKCAQAVGIEAGEAEAAAYVQLLANRWKDYEILNTRRDEEEGDEFWRQLTLDWLLKTDKPADLAPAVTKVAREKIFGQFVIYEDVIPTLDRLDELGVRVAIISNWDYTLHRILLSQGLTSRFEFALASLQEGVEKPEKRIFEIALEKLGANPEDVVHVGDDPVDDYTGPRNAGMRGLLIDRSLKKTALPRLATLKDIPTVMGWQQ